MTLRVLVIALCAALSGLAQQAPPMLASKKIWGTAPHSAFTDLIHWKGHFLCTFREGSGHVPGTNGKVRLIASKDGETWESWALLEEEGIDLRDPKICAMPDGSLLINCGGSDYSDGLQGWHTRVAFSDDGKTWSPPRRVRGIPADNWFFRLTWHDGVGYCMPNLTDVHPKTGRARTTNQKVALFTTKDGMNYRRASEDLPFPREACEVTLRFRGDEMWGIVRRSGGNDREGAIIRAAPPYTRFQWTPVKHGMGGPDLFPLKDGSWLVGTREYAFERPEGRDGTATVILRVQPDGRCQRLYEVPSGRDTSYPAFLLHDGQLWMSYYSGHQDKTQIYLAKVPMPAGTGR